MVTRELNISPVGRIEGDLDVHVYIEKGVVTRAHTQASMSRGFEKILQGKDPVSGLQVTPRVSGICGGSHLYCASSALDTVWKTTLPPNALLLRAIGQASESLQSDPRWFYAIFATDLANKKFSDKPLYDEVVRRWAAFAGTSFQEGLAASSKPVEIYAIFGGQWPHSSYMVPGGVMSAPTVKDITRAHAILHSFKNDWLEPIWLGCSIDRYMQIRSWDELMVWLNEKASHRNSDLGLFLRVGMQFGLDTFGQGIGRFIAFGTFLHKDKYNYPSIEGRNDALISPSGFYDGQCYEVFDHLKVREHVKHSWCEDYLATHPWDEPMPEAGAKVPRYGEYNAEVGPLARAMMNANPANLSHQYRDPLFGDVMDKMGPSVFVRCLARMHEATRLYTMIHQWLGEIDPDEAFYIKPEERDGKGFGASEAVRGALAHWIEIENGLIKNYQIVAPTSWNMRPQDDKGNPCAVESALTGLEIEDVNDPVEVGIVARSFDSCVVCTVHVLDVRSGKELARFKI